MTSVLTIPRAESVRSYDSEVDPASEMIKEMNKAGIHPTDTSKLRPDGQWHRLHGEGHKSSSRSIAVKLYQDYGYARDWRSGIECSWSATSNSWASASEREKYLQQLAAMRREEQQVVEEKQQRAAARAAEVWQLAAPANKDHPYLQAKQIQPGPARQADGFLLLKVQDATGTTRSLQRIDPSGKKILAKDGAKKGHFILVKGELPAETILIGEGFATMATVAAIAGAYPSYAVIAAIDAGNLLPVAQVIHACCPAARIVICADNDMATEGNPGRSKALEAARAVSGVIALPIFGDTETGSDWNDFAQLPGHVAAMICTIDAATKFSCADEEFAATLSEEYGDDFADTALDVAAALIEKVKGSGDQPIVEKAHRIILLTPGELPRAVDMAEQALLEHCPNLFQRAGAIVRPSVSPIDVADGRQIEGTRLVTVTKHNLAEYMTLSARWQKWDSRKKQEVDVDTPLKIADTYLAREGNWRLPHLAGVVSAPTLRHDGSVLQGRGYDPVSHLLVEPGSQQFPLIPASPSKEDAELALQRLEQLIETFPFVTPADRSVALSAIFTACIRRSLHAAPLHAFSAPVAGSGKSTLVDLAAIIACGRQAAVMTQGRDESEMEKRLGAALLAGDQVVSIDNATLPLDGDLLCQVCTQPTVRIRPLGLSILRDVPTNAALFATGNGLVIQGDMTRRTLLCLLDPRCERPEEREFSTNPSTTATSRRGEYLRDALLILRAFHVAGRPRQVAPLGSFEGWSDWVRSALLWLGRTDPVKTMERARQGDPKLDALRAVMHAWSDVVGQSRITLAELIRRAAETMSVPMNGPSHFRHEALREALMTVAGRGGALNSNVLGKWVSAHQNRIVDGMRLTQVAKSHGVAVWALVKDQGCA